MTTLSTIRCFAIMLTLLLMTPTVFLIVRRVFDLGDKAVARLRGLRKSKR